MEFSSMTRQQRLEKLTSKKWDMLVIGGGITGAGIALDAVTRGLSVALVEMQDFAAGTSSRSTKLIHGGLRYLKQMQVKMVAEVGKERAIVYENGPHVTTPERMLLPIYKGGTFGKFTSSLGISFYDFLAGVKREERREVFSVEETLGLVPFLKKENLLGGVRYVEYKSDDARLTLEVMKKANDKGAHPMNYTKVIEFLYENSKIVGAVLRDELTGEQYRVHAEVVINATGPWSDEMRRLDGSTNNQKHLLLTKGVHIVIDKKKFPLDQAVYFDTPDGRMVFAVPRGSKVYVGTTDTVYETDKVNPRMNEEDMAYILEAIAYIFPELEITRDDVESSWAGLRPLIHEEGKSPSEVSRKDEIWEAESGLYTIAGGKLTGYRKMAEQIVDLVVSKLPNGSSYGPCITKGLPISGGDVGGSSQFEAFCQREIRELVECGIPTDDAEALVRLYGSNIRVIKGELPRYAAAAEKYGVSWKLAISVLYGIEQEMMQTPADYFFRRVSTLLFDIAQARADKEVVIGMMTDVLGWSNAEVERYRQELEEQFMITGSTEVAPLLIR